MAKEYTTRIKHKRDTAAHWETNNPVLLSGELIIVDTAAGDVRFKIGDGTSKYTALPFQDEKEPDKNTTYSISKSGSTITLSGSDGSTSTVTDSNTTYTNATLGQGYGTCATAAATAAKVVTLSGYTLTVGGIVAVKFTYAVPASATMNVNSKGAKPIFYKGAAITANIIKAGDIATFIYDGTNYNLISFDRDTNTTYTNATSTKAGLMSANDVLTLNDVDIRTTIQTIVVPASGWVTEATVGYSNTVSASGISDTVSLANIQLAPSYVGNSAALTAARTWTFCETESNGNITFYSPVAITSDFGLTYELRYT